MIRTPAVTSIAEETSSLNAIGAPLRVFRVFVLAYCVWQASDLWATWRPHSSESWGWAMFGLWLVPALLAAIRGPGSDRPQRGLLATAVVLAFAGQMTGLNVVQHLALAFAIAGWRQPLPAQFVWLAASILWMPACGWLLDGVATGWELALRIVGITTVSAGTIVLPPYRVRRKRTAARTG